MAGNTLRGIMVYRGGLDDGRRMSMGTELGNERNNTMKHLKRVTAAKAQIDAASIIAFIQGLLSLILGFLGKE